MDWFSLLYARIHRIDLLASAVEKRAASEEAPVTTLEKKVVSETPVTAVARRVVSETPVTIVERRVDVLVFQKQKKACTDWIADPLANHRLS
jgi:hypothetical protein